MFEILSAAERRDGPSHGRGAARRDYRRV